MNTPWEYYDYCLDAYSPISPVQGKLSSNVLLENSFTNSPHEKTLQLLVECIRERIGLWNTVWGVKLQNKALHWELYFYNHGQKEPHNRVSNVLKIFRSLFEVPAFVEIDVEKQPYFMFSVDLSDRSLRTRRIEHVHLYTQGRLGTDQANSYYWGVDGLHFENHCEFFRQPKERRELLHKIKNSVFLVHDPFSFLRHDLVKFLMPCYQVCISQKTDKDGLYFSRVKIQQLLYFLDYFAYPKHIVDFVRSHSAELDHLLYDVAFDITLGPKGFKFGKSSYYGVF